MSRFIRFLSPVTKEARSRTCSKCRHKGVGFPKVDGDHTKQEHRQTYAQCSEHSRLGMAPAFKLFNLCKFFFHFNSIHQTFIEYYYLSVYFKNEGKLEKIKINIKINTTASVLKKFIDQQLEKHTKSPYDFQSIFYKALQRQRRKQRSWPREGDTTRNVPDMEISSCRLIRIKGNQSRWG